MVRPLPGLLAFREVPSHPGGSSPPASTVLSACLRQRDADQLVLGERFLPILVAHARNAEVNPEPDDVSRCRAQNILTCFSIIRHYRELALQN